MHRGRRESHWLVMRRCLATIRRAQRGAATKEQLRQAVLAEEGADAYGGGEEGAQRRRLEQDLERIRRELSVKLYYDRDQGGYILRDTWLPLLDLPDDDLATIAWLEETFGPDSPQHDEVHALLGRLRLYLAPERRAEIERRRSAPAVDLARRDDDRIAPAVWEALTRAFVERRRVELIYRSPQQEDAIPRRHVVDPWERYFDTARGHYYLYGYCHYTQGPRGRREQERYFHYRLGRIDAVQLLPTKLPPAPPPRARYAVEYELAPQVARLGISRHREIEIQEVERHPDGSATVRGTTDNLFYAVQALLHYGDTCRVLGGPEVLARMRRVVQRMAASYGE